jgi:putative Ca2+/H+ antiporter (TMEM165/GDT1 family)
MTTNLSNVLVGTNLEIMTTNLSNVLVGTNLEIKMHGSSIQHVDYNL